MQILEGLKTRVETRRQLLEPRIAGLGFAVSEKGEHHHADDQRRQDERGGEAEHVGGEPDEAHAEDRKRHPQANPAGAISAEALPYLTLHC
ncbi:hypothetical protein [Methyloceanibacter superfactus]|uniref:hypothetical protein n=1 Tax=Methyloceanibacter superfactus TaxID=1774969 RepID=UPI0013016CAC|nr:hypothetical protein [Methyloceanibacter superfactus]